MKFTLLKDENLDKDEYVITHNGDSQTISKLYDFLLNQSKQTTALNLYKDEIEYYININELIFFETSDNEVYAHTQNQALLSKYKLYELEELMPDNFVRVSKSCIANVNYIYSISRSLSAARLIKFNSTRKEVYVSRMYYPYLKVHLEKRLLNE